VSPAANANGWHNANVTVSFSGSDGLSGIDVCSANVVLTAEGAGQSGSGTCTDKAGNVSTSATASDINIDKTVPGITLVSVLPVANAHGWRNVDVTATWSCSDTLSGVVSATAQQTMTTEGANQSASATCTDKAGNVTSDTQTGISIDKTAPGLNPSVTPNPVLLNGAATAAGGGTDALAGIATQSCGAVDAASVGSKTLTCTATDKAGNSSTADASYSVQYASGGYCLGNAGRQILQPVNADGSSVFKKGSTVPAKFRVCDANGASVGLAGVVTSFRLIQTVNGTVADVDEPVISTTPDTAFRWSASDQQWIFNMNTKGLIANTTYVFRITLNDPGTPIDFRFGLK
jgi:hypothetical protein